MSVSLWRWSEDCEGVPCVGDCDLCDRNRETDVVFCKECRWYDGTPYCIETDFDCCNDFKSFCSKGVRK